MRIRTLPLILAVLIVPPVFAQNVDEIVDKYVEARGGKDALGSVQTVRAHGTMVMGGGVEQPFRYEWKRPNKIRLELTFQGVTEIQAFDGQTPWHVDPPGQPDPVEMSPFQFAMLNDGVDYVGPLVAYEAKGNKVELLGREEIEGTDAYKLAVTKMDGMVEYSYLDAEYFLEILQVEKYPTPDGSEMELEVTWGDYKEVGGVLLPFSWSRKPRGAPETGLTLMFEEIELNVEIPDSRFAMPSGE